MNGMNNIVRICACSCAPPRCPEIKLYVDDSDVEMVNITDDFNGSVKMTNDEFDALVGLYLETKLRKDNDNN